MFVEVAKGSAPEDIGGEPLLSIRVLASLLPVDGRELEDAACGPARQEAEEVAQVPARLDAVHLTAGEQRHKRRVDLGSVVGAHEEPVIPTFDLSSEGVLRDV